MTAKKMRSFRSAALGTLALGVVSLLCANPAEALKCKQTTFAEQVKSSPIVVFAEFVKVKRREGLVRLGTVLKGEKHLKGIKSLRWKQSSKYVFLPAKGTIALLYLSKSHLGKPDAKQIATVENPPHCNAMSVLQRNK